MIKYRMRFTKKDTGRFISHLDLLRIFARCARRCSIPLSYSQGFNPHPQIVFNAPIPLGMTSSAEYIDMTLDAPMSADDLKAKLSENLPNGIVPIWIRELSQGEGNIMKNVSFAAYELRISFENGDAESKEAYKRDVASKLSSDLPITVMKKSKSGVKETDIRPMIYSFELLSEEEGTLVYKAILSAGNENTLRPDTAVSAFGQGAALESTHKLYYTDINGSELE